MRHGRLASAIAFAALTGLAAGQPRPTQFGIDRLPEAPAATGALGLTPVAADAPGTDKPKLAPNTDPAPRTIPPAADKAADAPTPPPAAAGPAPFGPVTTLSPTPISAPAGGIPLFGAGPVDPGEFWVSAEYLWWRVRKDAVPPLVATGPPSFPVAFLGNAGTTVLLGGRLDEDTLTGVRLRAGTWLDACHTVGIEGS